MKCSHCNVEINFRTPVCPLCHSPFSRENGSLDAMKKLPRAFPKLGRPPVLGTTMFEKVYFFTALSIALITLVAEFSVYMKVRWFWIVSAGLVYVYFLIRGTIQDTKYFSQKVLAQAVFLSIIGFTLQNVLERPFYVFEYILPTIYLISMIMIGIYILANLKNQRKHLIHLLSVALLAFMPFAVVLGGSSPNWILTVITASLGGLIIIITIIGSMRNIVSEFRRLFHL
jgi:hypothetical protein